MIASIYIKEHSYLTDKPLTLNFGGEYLYSFEEIGKSLIISREKNEKYIPNFFNISESGSKIELLSAIVGENGVGKSSILDIIRSIFSKSYGFTHNEAVVLAEIEGKTKVLYSNTSFKYYLKESTEEIEKVNERESYQSIYYSPHFDLKYNSNYDELDKYDISLDEYIKEDLRYIEPSSDVHNQLCFKNTLRIIEFVSSDIFRRKEILSIFNIPNYEYASLKFNFKKINEKTVEGSNEKKIQFHNTPFQFRGIIDDIYKKLDYEIFIESYNLRNNNVDKIAIKKYVSKRAIILSMLSVIIDMLEERNTYLDEGILENKDSLNEESSDIVTLFLFFIKNTYVKNGGKYKIFQDSLFEDFLDEIFNIIDSTVDENDITDNTTIRVKVESIKNLIENHREIAKNFMSYPNMNHYHKNINQYEFITIDPLGRSLSSGEFAILNFFSKLYFFLKNKPTTLFNKKNFILLLDEADSGLHPMWKKGFITTILKSIPYFFEGLNSKPNLQIILTTHDPLTLSDISKHNVIFLEKTEEEKCQISSEVQKTFGANITDLLADSFFIKDGLIGDFAKSKINEVITWINENRNRTEINEKDLEHYQKVIELIDERVIKLKLSEMITELLPDNTFYNKVIDDEIKRLENLKKLKNDTNRYY